MQKEIPTTTPIVETTPETVVETPEVEIAVEGGDTTKSDPLDALVDKPQELLAEAKKFRGIASRKDKPKETPKPVDNTQFVTKEELYADNRKEAVRVLTEISGDDDSLKEVKTEFSDNWDDIMTFFVSRRGQSKPEDIVKDAMVAYHAWKADRGETVNNDSVRLLQSTVIGTAGGGSQKPTAPADTSDDARFSKPKPPQDWYPKKGS